MVKQWFMAFKRYEIHGNHNNQILNLDFVTNHKKPKNEGRIFGKEMHYDFRMMRNPR